MVTACDDCGSFLSIQIIHLFRELGSETASDRLAYASLLGASAMTVQVYEISGKNTNVLMVHNLLGTHIPAENRVFSTSTHSSTV